MSSAAVESPSTKPTVTVLDYGSGNVRSAVRALERAGAAVTLSAAAEDVLNADGLVVPGVGAFGSVMAELKSVDALRMIGRRVAGGRAVLGICVGMPHSAVAARSSLTPGLNTACNRKAWGNGPAPWSCYQRKLSHTWGGTPSRRLKTPSCLRASRTSGFILCTLMAYRVGTSRSYSRKCARR